MLKAFQLLLLFHSLNSALASLHIPQLLSAIFLTSGTYSFQYNLWDHSRSLSSSFLLTDYHLKNLFRTCNNEGTECYQLQCCSALSVGRAEVVGENDSAAFFLNLSKNSPKRNGVIAYLV